MIRTVRIQILIEIHVDLSISEPTPPPWAKSVKVHEFNGIDENKPYLGKVLDGPVAPEKYFQGVGFLEFHLKDLRI